MCGIAGAFSATITSKMREIVAAINQSQTNRGPDFSSIIGIESQYSGMIMGHTRLSIIDLSDAANQPLWDSNERYCISYNGEIYNYLELRSELENLGYCFKTASDTEVILNAFDKWQEQAFNRFNGPFAFAIFDKLNHRLWLVRDRFGVKPLYYFCDGRALYFASTARVLAKNMDLKPNLNYVVQGLFYTVYEDGSENTSYENLYTVQASQYIVITLDDDKKIVAKKYFYYSIQDQVKAQVQILESKSHSTMMELLQENIKSAVQLRLRADVPVGIALSGGLDSATIASIASNSNQTLQAFSFAHPQIKQSESANIKKLAKKINLSIDYIWPTSKEFSQKLLEVIRLQSAPFPNLSILAQYFVYQRARNKGIKVILGGQGCDEILMGYRKYQLFGLMKNWQMRNFTNVATRAMWLIPTVFAEVPRLSLYWKNRLRYRSNTNRQSLLDLPNPQNMNLSLSTNKTLVDRQIEDINSYSLPTLLRYEDRNSMGNGVESRLPFMDYRLVELSLALPEVFKLNKGYGKWAIRELMRDQLPEQISMARYKRGFDIPLQSYFNAGLGDEIRNLLKDHYDGYSQYLRNKINIDKVYSNERLIARKDAFGEVISLLWLAES